MKLFLYVIKIISSYVWIVYVLTQMQT